MRQPRQASLYTLREQKVDGTCPTISRSICSTPLQAASAAFPAEGGFQAGPLGPVMTTESICISPFQRAYGSTRWARTSLSTYKLPTEPRGRLLVRSPVIVH